MREYIIYIGKKLSLSNSTISRWKKGMHFYQFLEKKQYGLGRDRDGDRKY